MGNLLSVQSGVICQQVNCQGVMGAGLALAIRRQYPVVYDSYMRNYRAGLLSLGQVFLVRVSDSLVVANLCGQDRFGRDRQYTDYAALRTCFEKLRDRVSGPVYIPKNMGCGLAGGDWSAVSALIVKILPAAIII